MNRHGDRHEIHRKVYQEEREREKERNMSWGYWSCAALSTRQALGGALSPQPGDALHFWGGLRDRQWSFGQRWGDSFMHNHFLLLKFKRSKVKLQTQGHFSSLNTNFSFGSWAQQAHSIPTPEKRIFTRVNIKYDQHAVNVESEGPEPITNHFLFVFISDYQRC